MANKEGPHGVIVWGVLIIGFLTAVAVGYLVYRVISILGGGTA